MFFYLKRKKEQNTKTYNLEQYNTKESEPESSVMESSDYDFAMQKYSKTDFRYGFVQEYMKYIQSIYGITIFNCKFERPQHDSNFLNFYIYLWENDPDIQYRIEDSNNRYIKAFNKITNQYSILGITKEIRIQLFVKNIRHVMYGRILESTWRDIHCGIKDFFPEIEGLSYWSDIYVFIKKEEFSLVVENTSHLESIKKYCYEMAKKNDVNNIMKYDQFHIRVDNYENYQSIGGQHYFNSDFMFDCLLF